jgi:hypothetical protein
MILFLLIFIKKGDPVFESPLYFLELKTQGVKSLAPFDFNCPWTCKRMSERIPFALILGLAPSVSEIANNTVAISAWLADAQAKSAANDIIASCEGSYLIYQSNLY